MKITINAQPNVVIGIQNLSPGYWRRVWNGEIWSVAKQGSTDNRDYIIFTKHCDYPVTPNIDKDSYATWNYVEFEWVGANLSVSIS